MNLLFFGEQPPSTVTGISLSNKINLDLLSEKFQIDVIEEFSSLSEHSEVSLTKLFSFLKYCFKVFIYSTRKKYAWFYLTFSLSVAGSLKTFMLTMIFRLMNPKAKIILHIHRGDFLSFYSIKILPHYICKLIMHNSDLFLFLSKEFITDTLPYSYKFRVLPNTLTVKAVESRDFGTNNFVFISNYIRGKGILDLLETVSEFSDSRIILNTYGSFTSEELKSKILSYSASNIRVNGPIYDEILKYEIIKSSDCLILPSYNEGQPLVILEAMAMGTLVIATNVGDIINMLGEDYPLIIECNNKTDLKKAILKVLAMSIQEKLIISGKLREKFKRNYSLEKHKEQLFSIFTT